MKKFLPVCITLFLALILACQGFSQGLPPGWDYGATPSTHIISIPLSSEPNINGYLLNPGDYIGVFYTDDNGEMVCGGATEWLGDQNTGIIAFGDDAFTGEKDGFASGEAINYRFYSWSVHKEYEAQAICNDGLPVSCGVFVSQGLSGVDSLWANGFYLVAGASPDSVCAGSETQLAVIPSGGSGNYSYNWTSDPPGFNSDIPDPIAMPEENTTYTVFVQDVDETLEISLYVSVFPEPAADAGPDITICEDSVVTVSGNTAHSSGFYWETEGDGTFNNANLLSPEYTPGPGDLINGDVTLNFTALPIEPCTNSVVASMDLSVTKLPVVQAGNDQTICEDQNVNASATLLNAVEVLWSSTGDGTFSNPSQIETEYFPGSGDIETGEVEITATALALSPCSGVASDQFIVQFAYLPQIAAGNDQVICETESAELAGSVVNSSVYYWQTSGDGTFDDATSLNATYFPGTQDISSGNAELFLTGEPDAPCSGNVSDALLLSIIPEPTINAGDDETICETANLQLNGNASDYDEVMWSTSGDGTFSDNNNLSTIYFPGTDDLLNQSVQIQLIAQPLYPCDTQVLDGMQLSIMSSPVANAGEDFTIHWTETYPTMGEASDYSSVLWSSQGDGTFDDESALETVYTPGSVDIGNAGTVLKLTAFPINPCVSVDEDDMILSIDTVTSVHDVYHNNLINLYPNPTTGVFYIEYQDSKDRIIEIYVYDKNGIRISQIPVNSTDSEIAKIVEMNLSTYEPGIYILKVKCKHHTYSSRIVLMPD